MKQSITAQKMKFSIKDFFSKCDQIRKNLQIWSHLLKKSLMENFIFCAVYEQYLTPLNKYLRMSNVTGNLSLYDVNILLKKNINFKIFRL